MVDVGKIERFMIHALYLHSERVYGNCTVYSVMYSVQFNVQFTVYCTVYTNTHFIFCSWYSTQKEEQGEHISLEPHHNLI